MAALTNQGYLDDASAAITQQRSLLYSIHEINLRFLLAVSEALELGLYQAGPELGVAKGLFRTVSPKILEEASHFPFLLMDLGLDNVVNVQDVLKRYGSVQDMELHPHRSAHLAVARSALVVGWYAARADNCATLLMFGFSPSIAEQLTSLPLHEVEALAPPCISPMTLRWRTNPLLWGQLLKPNAYSSVDTVRGFVMHAAQLTAARHLVKP